MNVLTFPAYGKELPAFFTELTDITRGDLLVMN